MTYPFQDPRKKILAKLNAAKPKHNGIGQGVICIYRQRLKTAICSF